MTAGEFGILQREAPQAPGWNKPFGTMTRSFFMPGQYLGLSVPKTKDFDSFRFIITVKPGPAGLFKTLVLMFRSCMKTGTRPTSQRRPATK